jgi:hypothetical protein
MRLGDLGDGFFAADSPSSLTEARTTPRGSATLLSENPTRLTRPVAGHCPALFLASVDGSETLLMGLVRPSRRIERIWHRRSLLPAR